MKICFPARKANGDNYATVDDMMQPLLQEPHGSWLAGTNNMWHGGIHITSKSAPGSVLTSETADTAVPLQFMAGGEVVAWRINQDYLTGKYINNPLQYSGTFVLVKSTCTPDPEKKDNSLDFYTLYIGLAPLSAFPEHKLYQVTDKGDGLSQREYTGKEKDGDKAPVAKNKLKTGDSVIVLRETTFDLKGQTQTFGLARALNSKSEMTGKAFWMSLDPQYVTPVGEQRAHLPAWMRQAVAQGTFDAVVKPATKMEVAAGDAVGYLAEDIAPCDLHGVEKSAFVHIEVLSTDSRMKDFLSNKAQVKSGPKYIHIHPESFIYSRSGDTFTQTKGKVKKDIHKIMLQDKCHPFKDSSGKRWFDIEDGAWVSGTDVDADICQYDLDKLGFKAFEEPSTSDMTKSLHEGWIKDGFTRMAEWVRPERGIREKQVSDYYKAILRKMDSDNSGDLSGEELRHAVNYAELDVRDIAARMVVKHDSEWFGGCSHHRWRTFLKQLDPLCVSYVRQWFDDMEWMSKVDGFSSGAPVWHMHPVVFLDAINVGSEYEVTVELIEKLLGHTNPWFTGKRGGKAFSTHFKNNYPKVYEFDKQNFVSEFNEQLIAYGITGAYHKAHFLSQCLHESAHFDTTLEFGSGRNYDPGQHKDAVKNGNTVVGDGPRYKGRGLIQLTWKNNYRRFSSYSGVDCVANPELVASVMSNAIKASCWFWRNNGGVHKKYDARGDVNILIDSEKNNVELITLAVNGGKNGLTERQGYFDAIKKEWGLK
ncbi:glycoside hydrolase family 19 protein [Scandinavium sp. V105_16]|uniref:Glycoside hydrolase family 19 protein n=1 Tax=Scandinavium lactucae TaxID=3095028 RepID=A0AAJ2VU20_9ENTR|nr:MULTISPECIES: glycoside hydrolase family 19 protein [unclassified Scandinavium]MDX6019620.1 glycoside hydrolase family 19 protein [Scandinavium sp. V105_16]MDX6032636.1 glycoside hydrolase family 19 protein [Scandinavium sp. V105_12]